MTDPNEFKILLATDVHLGYQHKHELRGRDSLETFEEILRIGKEETVDFILLGGDLFHENRPPRHIVNRCIQLLREYTWGDKDVEFDIVSDHSVNFEAHGSRPWPNYLDPNINVAIPVFSIHGNHDDPTGCGAANAGVTLSVLNTLADAGFINYFGRQTNLQEVRIHPILFEKGSTKLAVFGLGALREERLHRLWRENKVHLMQQPGNARDDWFNIFVIHQNRVRHTDTSYVSEESIDRSMDLIFWGHEHDCQINPVKNVSQDFFVTQPGSSIATSLCEGETAAKHVGILRVKGKNFKITPIELKTVRQFYWKDVTLYDHIKEDQTERTRKEHVEKFCRSAVEKLILLADSERKPSQPKEPLIRLRVNRAFKSGNGAFETFNLYRFGEQFKGQVANTKDIIQFKLSKPRAVKEEKASVKLELDDLTADSVGCMKDVVVRCLQGDNRPVKDRLLVQAEKPLTEAMAQYVEKGVGGAIDDYVTRQIENMATKLEKRLNLSTISKEGVAEDIRELAEKRQNGQSDILKDEQDVLKASLCESNKHKTSVMKARCQEADMDIDNDDLQVKSSVSPRARGSRGAQSGRGSRGGRGRGRGRGRTVVDLHSSHINDFLSQSSKNSNARSVIAIDNSDEDSRPRPSNTTPKAVMDENRQSNLRGRTKKYAYDSSSDEDYDATPAMPKRGRR